jgi:3-hydroxyisobutyrate dehydrogenase-like beta-hydroxyacid dehydrogenase
MKIGVFGLGIIGGTWAGNLHADGDEVRGWNRTPKTLPFYTARAEDAARGAELIIIVVTDPPAVQSVLDMVLPVLQPGQIVMQSSTVSPLATREFARQVGATGALFLEAPFTGSKPAAEQRQTVFYIGGDPALLERARPVLSRLGRTVLHVGPIGSASALKLAMNLNIALVAQALCESRALARSAGLPDDIFFSALKINASHSGVADLKEPKLRTGEFSPQFSLKHMAKDLRLALETGQAVPLPQTQELVKLYGEGLRRGWGDEDFVGLVRLLG